jgi:hypothetical protein
MRDARPGEVYMSLGGSPIRDPRATMQVNPPEKSVMVGVEDINYCYNFIAKYFYKAMVNYKHHDNCMRSHCDRDRVVVGFTISYAIRAYHH